MSATPASAMSRLMPTDWMPSLSRSAVAVLRSRSPGVSVVLFKPNPASHGREGTLSLIVVLRGGGRRISVERPIFCPPSSPRIGSAGGGRPLCEREDQLLGLLQVGAGADLAVEGDGGGEFGLGLGRLAATEQVARRQQVRGRRVRPGADRPVQRGGTARVAGHERAGRLQPA